VNCITEDDHMSEQPPPGLTPILAVSDARAAIAFYARAFGAMELARIPAPDEKRFIHVRMVVFGTVFVFMDEIPELASNESRFHSPDRLQGTSVTLHLQVPDAGLVWSQALHAGAIPVIPLAEQFWGELYGRLKDPFGHEWTIAQSLNLLGSTEVREAAASVFNKKDKARFGLGPAPHSAWHVQRRTFVRYENPIKFSHH
jgi:PhnB protein